MFRNAKSAFIWYHLYKFRRTLVFVALLLFIVLFSQWIYSDVVEYLRLRQKLQYLDYILPLKWGIIFFNMGLSVYLILSLFKRDKSFQKKEESKPYKEEFKKEKFTDREKMFLHKKKLKTKEEMIVESKRTE